MMLETIRFLQNKKVIENRTFLLRGGDREKHIKILKGGDHNEKRVRFVSVMVGLMSSLKTNLG